MKLPTEDKIKEIIDNYFIECQTNNWLPTKRGLISQLGIERRSYCRWIKRSPTLKKGDEDIENAWVQKLQGNSVAGVIFYLKNAFGYRDRQDLDVTSAGKPLPPFDYVKSRNNNRNK